MKKVMVIAAHPDDEVLGCGGTIARHIREGDEVTIRYMTWGRDRKRGQEMAHAACKALGVSATILSADLPDNAMDKVSLLTVVQFVETWAEYQRPDIVYTHHRGDLNVDHRITYAAVMTAFRPWVRAASIYSFEIPSSTECGLIPFTPNHYVSLMKSDMDALNKAAIAYESELKGPRSYYEDMRKIRGSQIGRLRAEAFQVEKQVWR